MTPHAVVHRDGTLRLLRFLRGGEPVRGPPVVLVYALVNRYPILDLVEDRSVVGSLLDGGLDVFLVDWGAPTVLDAHLGLEDYADRLLDGCVRAVRRITGEARIGLVGYCQGGTFSAMYAALHPEALSSVVLMAAPLSFDRERGLLTRWARAPDFRPELLAAAFGGVIPQGVLDPGFTMMRPVRNTLGELLDLHRRALDADSVEAFLGLRDWVLDGVPQAGAAFSEFVRGLYVEDRFARGGLAVGARTVRLADVRAPVLLFSAAYDHVVPPGDSLGAYRALDGAERVDHLLAPTDHFGLSVDPAVHRDHWPRIARWVRARALPEARRRESPGAVGPEVATADAAREGPPRSLDDFAREDPCRLADEAGVSVEFTRRWVAEAAELAALARRRGASL